MRNICSLCDRQFLSDQPTDYCQVCNKARRFRIWRCRICEMYYGECLQKHCFSLTINAGKIRVGDFHGDHEWVKVTPEQKWVSIYKTPFTNEDMLIQSRELKKRTKNRSDYMFGF